MAKEFLSRKGVAYTERNIMQDRSAMDDLRQLGYMTTPVILVNNEVIVGFDEARLLRLLGA